MAEYEAYIMGIRATIERKIMVLETRDPKLIDYRRLVLELIKEFDNITFCYLPRNENQMADALATLASMVKVNIQEDVKSIQMSIYENHEYPEQAIKNDKRTLRRLSNEYVLDGEVLYKRRKDQVLLRCVDAVEAKKILKEVHEGVCRTHAKGDCINYAKRCHKCQIYGDKIHVSLSPLYVVTSPRPFSMWGMDVIGPISPKASNGYRFIFVAIDYFTK
ncbi:RNA-directed DNA polymerase (Reverse transcriptase), Ribonuclease H [Gossypium australe]|uniref:RNA-directed DNA polymerase (Reverse transcriptase), Ribonuclease H n=1 Tax=Gossypium australe TaxID=47621 RepID=A0A5B6UWP5_9ROSI|nr:RNA-directed DNA polymerase (Reverse transcriptase), Ribonuclease H [Gossypium australe]